VQLRAVCFDFVNTLAEFHNLAFKDTSRNLHHLLMEADFFQISYSQFHRSYTEVIKEHINIRKGQHKEVSNLEFIVGTLKRLGIEVDPLDPRLKAIVNAYFSPFKESLRIFPRTRETLATLKEEYQLKLGVISNFTSTRAIHEFLTHLDLTHFFDAIIVSAEVGVRKPHTHIFATALEKLRVDPVESIFVGDDVECDIAGANSLGMITIQVGAPTPPPIDQLAERTPMPSALCVPDYKIDSIYEVVEIIQSLHPL
jgi:putative hydrolase of the HAD superfamily